MTGATFRTFDDYSAAGRRVGNRVTPHDLDAERAVLGAILLDSTGLSEAVSIITLEMFFRAAHRRIFNHMMSMAARDVAIDMVTLKHALAVSGELDEIGGPVYLAALIDGVPHSTNVTHYAEIIRDLAQRREALVLAARLSARIDEGSDDVASLLSEGADRLRVLAEGCRQHHRTSLIDDEELMNLPEPDMLIDGLIPSDSLVLIYGASDAYKSFLAVDLSLAVATNGSWLGAKVLRPGNVIYAAAEGFHGLKKRVRAWKARHGFALAGPLGFISTREPLNLLDPTAVDAFIASARPKAPVVVVVDTCNRSMPNGDENSSKDMGRAIDSLARIRRELHAVVVPIHHTGRDGKDERGHTSLRGAMDTRLKVTCAGLCGTVTCERQKDLAPFSDISFRMVPEGDSLVVVADAPANSSDVQFLTGDQLKCLVALCSNFGPEGATVKDWRKPVSEVKPSTWTKARQRLLELGYVTLPSTSGGRVVATSSGRRRAEQHSR